MKRIVGYIICLLTFGFAMANEDANKTLHEGNALYKIAEYSKSIQKYEEVLKAGYEAPELYYNLGNAYFRLHEYPEAILNYERALRLSPKDQDILTNLEIANSRIEDKVDKVPKVFFVKWIQSLSNVFSLNVWAIIAIVLLFATCILTFLYLKSSSFYLKRSTFSLGILCFLLFLLSFGLGNHRYASINKKSEAIVFQPLVVAKSSPQSTSVEKFVIHQGTKVFIQEELGGWIKIRLANGNVGWIEETTVKII